MKKEIEGKTLNKMYEIAKFLLKTSPRLNEMLDACKTEEEKKVKLAMAVSVVMGKDSSYDYSEVYNHNINVSKAIL